MEIKTKQLTELSVEELAEKLINFGWNSTNREYAASKILKLIYPQQNFDELLKFLKSEQKRMNEPTFNSYYGNGVIEVVKILQTSFNSAFGVDAVMSGLKNSIHYRKFNWKNFSFLIKENMLNILDTFDSKFRGNLKKIHRVYNDKYIIIETEILNEPDTFYIYKENRVQSYCTYNFEQALFYAMVGETLSQGMMAIFEYHNNNKK